MSSAVVIKDVDEQVFKNLKAEAVRAGLKIGEAATQAFKLWIQSRAQQKVKDIELLKEAAEIMDKNRAGLSTIEGWSSVQVIRSSDKRN
ncbi:MAG: hypothetical protein HY929_07285 [Euryarchaeota archaeon]|nr:hypothetical protein [Euryarchaeota archaeon]